ncbi:MAG: hypothetical protein K2G73_09025 [Eubacterium sp.]|nr:hypothetical protein [Eubacterium sp.]
MRCKNCGTENDDKRYICENCGSPLYDEEDFNTPEPEQQARSYDTVNSNSPTNSTLPPTDSNNHSNNENKLAEKKSIIVIAILVVLLVAIIASVAVVASTKSKNETSSSSTSSTSQTLSTKQSTTKERTTERTTEKETTTESTTTTTTTTKQQNWSIKLVSHGGGTVDGSGSYKDGDNVTITATPDDGYEFDGWYSNGTKISSTMRYSFTAAEDVSISAVFSPVSTTEAPTIEDMDGGMD